MPLLARTIHQKLDRDNLSSYPAKKTSILYCRNIPIVRTTPKSHKILPDNPRRLQMALVLLISEGGWGLDSSVTSVFSSSPTTTQGATWEGGVRGHQILA